MANDDEESMNGEALVDDNDVGWEWERDLESQGHGECWRASHLEDGLDSFDAGEVRSGEPSGYRRSDVRIYEDVCELLFDHPMLDATKVEVEVADGVVVLRGHVSTRQEITVIIEIIEDIAGVARQEILLRVRSYEPIRWEEIGEEASS